MALARPRWAILGFAAALFVGAHAAAAVGGGGWWGLHHLRYLGPAAIAAVVVASAAGGAAVRWSRRIPPLVGGAAAFPLLWLLRDRGHWLGDGSVLLDRAGAPLVFHEREPLGALVVQRVLDVAPRLGLSPATGGELASCLLGVALVVALLRLDAAMEGNGLVFALVFLGGAAQLFFGYIETYPAVALAVAGFLVAARAPAARPATVVPTVLLFLLALLLHVSSIVLAPALALVVYRQLRLRATAALRGRLAGEAAAAVGIAWLVWSFAFRGVGGARSIPEYLAILAEGGEYTYSGVAAKHPGIAPPLGSIEHAAEWLHLQLLLVPVALPLAVLGVARDPRAMLRDGWAGVLAVASAGFLVAQFLFFPHLGAPRDWDVLAAGAFPIALLAATALPRIRSLGPLLVALAAFHTLPWILVNAIPRAAQARFEEMPMPGGQASFVLGVRAMKRGDFEEAVVRLRRAVEEAPLATPGWVAFANALEKDGRSEEARDAYRRALSLSEQDPRVDRGEVFERLGLLEWQLRRREEAVVVLEAALRERPASIVARVLLSHAALEEGRPERALELLGPVLERRDENPTILVLRGRALSRLGRRDDAAAALDEAARLFPGDPSVRAARQELDGSTPPPR
jgi:Tfp pilus assembly protein PilF